MPHRTSGEEIAVEKVTRPTPQPDTEIEPKATVIIDVRSVPLAMLTVDADARHMVGRILDRMDGPTRVSVAKFNSAI
jgi:FXSXX-COOH protein